MHTQYVYPYIANMVSVNTNEHAVQLESRLDSLKHSQFWTPGQAA